MRILVIEDDTRLRTALTRILEEQSYEVDAVDNGTDGLSWGRSDIYDVIICDIMLPGMNGFEIVSQLRREKVSTPILMLTALGEVSGKIKGYDYGADDYMTKPFNPDELLAHLRALTRRRGEVVFETMDFADLSLNLDSGDLSCKGNTIHLSAKEFALAKLLIGNAGAVASKDLLIERVWGLDAIVDDNNVESYISFLRKKLKFLHSDVRIATLRKIGYRLEVASMGGTDGASEADDNGAHGHA